MFKWLREGGIREDDGNLLTGSARYLRHFHDPLAPWDEAGLRLVLLGQYESSIRWMQRPDQDAQARGTGNWSWPDAKRFYTRALTARGAGEREQAWADTFRALGHVMHLVVDASVPEHTRNDPHPLGGVYGSYEYWVSAQHGPPGSPVEQAFVTRYLSGPIAFDRAILQQPTADNAAPAPIARLIDTDTYRGLATGPNVTLSPAIGIAEFAHANFFSEDTGTAGLFLPDYPFPKREALVRYEASAPTGRARAYYRKGEGDGLAVDPVLAECVLDDPGVAAGIAPATYVRCTDEKVWARVAEAMLPRAVSYAQGLLDYFFRGRLEARLETFGGADPHALRLTNRNDGESLTGTVELYYDTAGGNRERFASWALTLAPNAESDRLALPPTPPNHADPGRYLLVFRGQLGAESDAVVARWIGVGIYRLALSYDTFSGYDAGDVQFMPPSSYTVGSEYALALPADAYANVWLLLEGGGGSSQAAETVAIYRNVDALPGDVATIRFIGYCAAGTWWDAVEQSTTTPVTAELVELEAPRDLAALEAYTASAPPAVRRQLSTFSITAFDWPAAGTAQLDLQGVRFLGLRLVSEPVAPVPPPPRFYASSLGLARCRTQVDLRIPR